MSNRDEPFCAFVLACTRRGIKSTVRVQYFEPGVELTCVRQPGEPLGDAGDDYTGLVRFNPIEDVRWMKTATVEGVDRFQYGFDRGGQRTWRRNRTAPENNFDESYSYDALGQLIALARGSLNGRSSSTTMLVECLRPVDIGLVMPPVVLRSGRLLEESCRAGGRSQREGSAAESLH